MNIEQIIRRKRSLEYAVKTTNDQESNNLLKELIEEYNKNLLLCKNSCYLDYGYYKFHNNDIYKATRDDAEIRTIICLECGKEIHLIKTNNIDWDYCINGIDINIIPSLDSEILLSEIIELEIKNLLNKYSNLKQQYCGHLEFINRGYYSVQNQSVKKGNYNNSDFRIVTCKTCKKTMLLPKTENEQWNATIENQAITVTKTKKNMYKTL